MKHHLLIPLFCLSLWPLTATAETVWLSDLPVVPNQESENLGQALFYQHQLREETDRDWWQEP